MNSNSMSQLLERLRVFAPQVDRVADASRAVKVEVTEADVTGAKEKSHGGCAMARACQRQVCDAAIVWPRVAFLIKGNLAVRYSVPESVRREIVTFDRHGKFYPGTYQLSPICPSARFGARMKPGRGPHISHKTWRRPLVTHQSQGIRSTKPQV